MVTKKKNLRFCLTLAVCLMSTALCAQASFSEATTLYLLHSSGNHLEMGSDTGGWIESPTKSSPQQMTLTPDGKGYYSIQVAGQQKFLSLSGQWNSAFIDKASGDEAKWP